MQFENDTFHIYPHRIDEKCTCGYDTLERQWEKENSHDKDCYRLAFEKKADELASKGIYLFTDEFVQEIEQWAKNEQQYDGDNLYGYCSCGYMQAWQSWYKTHSHEETCAVVKPNFMYRPEDVRIWWNQKPFVSATSNANITDKMFKRIIRECIRSLD